MHNLFKFASILAIFAISEGAYVQSTPTAVTLPYKPTGGQVSSQFWGKWNGNGKIVTPLEGSQVIQQIPVSTYENLLPNFQHFGVYQAPTKVQYDAFPYYNNLDYFGNFMEPSVMMPFDHYMNTPIVSQYHGQYPSATNGLVYNHNW